MSILHQAARVLGLLFGIAIGGTIAFLGSGWGGAAMGLVLGLTVGWTAALLPPEIVRHAIVLSLRRSDSNRLKEHLARNPELAPFVLEVLVSRGEPVEPFRECALSLLRSKSRSHRNIGRMIARTWFPDLPG